MTRLLVLGGTSFVGRAVVRAALADGVAVATLNRGVSHPDVAGVRALHADRNDPESVRLALSGESFDAVVDVSGLAPAQVRATARVLRDRVSHYSLVSTVTTYSDEAFEGRGVADVIHEGDPTVPGDPDDPDPADMARYGEQKRGCELAVLREFGADASLIARPGLILGPHENVHRIPYWLGRIAAGGDVIAPGHPDRGFQFVDVDDLAAWLVAGSLQGLSGTYNVINPPGRDTWQDWLTACIEVTGSHARLHWLEDQVLIDHGVMVGFGLPMWFATDLPGFDDTRLRGTGFRGRPLSRTVATSWEWLRREPEPWGGYRPAPITRDVERTILAATEWS